MHCLLCSTDNPCRASCWPRDGNSAIAHRLARCFPGNFTTQRPRPVEQPEHTLDTTAKRNLERGFSSERLVCKGPWQRLVCQRPCQRLIQANTCVCVNQSLASSPLGTVGKQAAIAQLIISVHG